MILQAEFDLVFVPSKMLQCIVLVLAFFQQDSVPYKPSQDFEIKFDFSFKQRPFSDDSRTVRLNETRAEYQKRHSNDPLPYLILKVKILRFQADEVRVRVIKDDKNTVFSKKAEEGLEFKIDLGFTDDIKDRISGYKHVIQFLTADKKEISRILIEFDEEGNYMVNGEKRGKV